MDENRTSLLYVSTSNSSSTAANAIQVYDQVEAFVSINLNVDLICFSVEAKPDSFKFSPSNSINLIKVPRLKYLRYAFFSLYTLIYLFVNLDRYQFIYGRHVFTLILAALFCRQKVGIEIHSKPSKKQLMYLKVISAKNNITLYSTTCNLQQYLSQSGLNSFVINDACNPKYWLQKHPKIDSKYVLYTGGLFEGKIDLHLLEKIAMWCTEKNFLLRLEGDWSKASVSLLRLRDKYSCITSSNRFLQKREIAKLQKSAYALLLLNPARGALSMSGENIDIGLSPLKLFEYLFAKKPIISTKHPEITNFIQQNTQFSSRVSFIDDSISFNSLATVLDGLIEIVIPTNDNMIKYTYLHRAKKIMEYLI